MNGAVVSVELALSVISAEYSWPDGIIQAD